MQHSTLNNQMKSDDRNTKALELLKQARILNFARLANMLVDLFGLEEGFEKVGKRVGQEVELQIPSLNGVLSFTLVSQKADFICRAEEAKQPAATIILKVKKDNVIKVLSNIIKSRANIFGLMKLVPKFLLGKIKVKGSLLTVLALVRCIMIGKNEVYNK
jgi:hypothetical protein